MRRFPTIGEQFGDYEITGQTGQGGMGVVFTAVQTRLSRTVALKVLSAHLSDEDDYRHRFTREAEILSRLDSPHIVHIYDYGDHDGWLYLAMQLVRGGDLAHRLHVAGAMAAPEALRIATQVASALEDAHAVGIIHRDVKPNNVLLREGASTFSYLCDFGIARSDSSGLTQTGTVVGSWAYLAPERCNGEPATASSDLYSLGCLLWTMTTGSAPYAGTDVQVAMSHVSAPVPQLEERDGTTAGLNEVLRRSMAKNPRDRYASAAEMRAALERVTSTRSTSAPSRPVQQPIAETAVRRAVTTPALPANEPARPAAAPRRRAQGIVLMALLAALLIVAVGLGATLVSRHDGAAGDAAKGTADTGSRSTSGTSRAQQTLHLTRASFDGDQRSDLQVQSYHSDGSVTGLISTGTGFSAPAGWASGLGDADIPHRLNGDFDGDGRADLAAVDDSTAGRQITVSPSGGSSFGSPEVWATLPSLSPDDVFYVSGDYDGNGREDLAAVSFDDSGVLVDLLLSNGHGFTSSHRWIDGLPLEFNLTKVQPGDFNGDGLTDLALIVPSDGGLTLSTMLSTGTRFDDPNTWSQLPGASLDTSKPIAADFDGDGLCDLVIDTTSADNGSQFLFLRSTKTRFDTPRVWRSDPSWSVRRSWISAGDVDDDGHADVIRIAPGVSDGIDVWVLLSDGTSFRSVGVWGHDSSRLFDDVRTLGVIG